METIAIEIEPRNTKGTLASKSLRRNGTIPGVVYTSGKESSLISVSALEFLRKTASASSSHFFKFVSTDKQLDGQLALIKEVQTEPIKDKVLHVDFLAVREDKPVRVKIALTLVGEAPLAVKQGEADVAQISYELEIECLPKDIPSKIEVDISGMQVGHAIHAGEITLPQNVEMLSREDLVIVTLAAHVEEEPVAEAAAPAGAEGATPATADGGADAAKADSKKGS